MLFYLQVSVSPGQSRCAAARARAAPPAPCSAGRCGGARARSASSGRPWTTAQLKETQGMREGMETTGKPLQGSPHLPLKHSGSRGLLTSDFVLGKVSEHFKPLTCANAHPTPLSELYFHSRAEIILASSKLFPAVIYTSISMSHSETVDSSVISWFLQHHVFSPLPAHRAAGDVTVRDRKNYIFSSTVLHINCS